VKVQVITDSTSDIPQEMVEKLGIRVVSLAVDTLPSILPFWTL
jgi:fatty acid-binding protein DegV